MGCVFVDVAESNMRVRLTTNMLLSILTDLINLFIDDSNRNSFYCIEKPVFGFAWHFCWGGGVEAEHQICVRLATLVHQKHCKLEFF